MAIVDGILRFSLLYQAGLCYFFASIIRDPDWKMRLEMQAMGAYMLFRNFRLMPTVFKRRLYLQVLLGLMVVSYIIVVSHWW